MFFYLNLFSYREFQETNNDIEIGITPAAGLQPPTYSVAECFNEQKKPKTAPVTKGRMMTTRQLASAESRSVTKEVSILYFEVLGPCGACKYLCKPSN